MDAKLSHFAGVLNKPGISSLASYEATAGSLADSSTLLLHDSLERAYLYFSEQLFENKLTAVVRNLDRSIRCLGYFKPAVWSDNKKALLPELNLHPDILSLSLLDISKVLVHEMMHHFQHLYGTPGKSGYHNMEFSRLMFTLGLATSSTGLQGGKRTGRTMSEYVIDDGKFINAFNAMPKEIAVPFYPIDDSNNTRIHLPEKKYNKNKTRFECPTCGNLAWGKPELRISCDDCHKSMQLSIRQSYKGAHLPPSLPSEILIET